jgi:hypothetical protein
LGGVVKVQGNKVILSSKIVPTDTIKAFKKRIKNLDVKNILVIE